MILKIKFDKTKKIEECNKIIKNGNIDINEWSKIITKINPKHLDGHFSPQTLYIYNLLDHDNIILYDTFSTCVSLLISH